MHNTPKVSVLIPCYNYARYVAQAMESVLAQTDPDLELIVVDNGSTDNSWEVIQGIQDPRIKTLRLEENRGIRGAWMVGLEMCRGEWFSFVSADDYVAPQKHEVLLNYAAEHPEADVLSGYVEHVDEHGERMPEAWRWMEMVINQARDLNAVDAWMLQHFVCMPAALYRRRYCRISSTGSDVVSDYNFHLRFLENGRLFAQVPEIVATYRSHGQNTTMRLQTSGAQHFAYSYAAEFLPLLRRSGQAHRAHEAIQNLFGIYHMQIRESSRQAKGTILLCMFWPDWVMENCPDFGALSALDWESRVDEHHFHAVRAMLDDTFQKWNHVEKSPQPSEPGPPPPQPSEPSPPSLPHFFPAKREQKRSPLRDAARTLERKVRRFIRGTK